MSETISPGTKLGRYEMQSLIGAGGMGEVFLAHDTKLDRKVAIKFLNHEFSKDADKLNRFIREAKAASALNHPNILTVYEIGETDDTNYIVTEFIEGQTLRECLAHKDNLQLNQILKIGVQVSEALSAAHQAGIIHRDIKPENIMIRKDGYAKVLDFGLAKLSEPPVPASGQSASEDATRAQVNTTPGMVMGTVSYMSPEQARANPTDARTDIWSIGVVLYEMLAGKVPFSGETVNHTIVGILEKEPLQLENVPSELQRIVRKSLTKDVEMRYQSARDLLIDLKNLRRELDFQGELERSTVPNRDITSTSTENATQMLSAAGESTVSGQTAATQNVTKSSSSLEYAVTQAKSHKLATAIAAILVVGVISSVGYFGFLSKGSSAGQINSIAVLPFENRSGSADTDYLSDGLADSLIYRLSQLPNLKVSPTSSIMRYKGKETDVAQIAKELEVDAVMSGRLSQRGDDLSISVQLIDSRTQKLIWAEQYDRKMADLLATQREIATTITQKLQLKLAGAETKGITKKYTDSNEAYQLYLKGLYYFARRTKEGFDRSIDSYQQAVALDPKFALAYARIAEAYNQVPSYPYGSPKEAIPKAKAAAEQALQIDPTLAEAHTALANSLAVYDWDQVEAEREFKRGIELDPNSSAAHFRYGQIYLAPQGQLDEAIVEIKRGLDGEPMDINMGSTLSWVYQVAGQNDKALEQAKKVYELEPTHPLGRWNLGFVYVSQGMYAEAIDFSEKNLQNDPTNQRVLWSLGFAYAKAGRRDKAEEVINRFKELGKTQYVPSCRMASIYGALGDKDKAFAELEKALEARDWDLFRLKIDPLFAPLHDDARFKEMLRRLNLPE